jgi:hypothetical protein
MKTYPSKVDWWLAAILIATPLILIVGGLFLIPISTGGALSTVLVGIFAGSLIAAMSLPCRYVLDDEGLFIQYGLRKEKIKYKDIRDAELSSNPLSAPALSLSRVKVLLKSGFRLISPQDRETFISELKKKI